MATVRNGGLTIRSATEREDSSGPRVKVILRGTTRLGFVGPSNYGGRSGPEGKWFATASDGKRIMHLGSGYRTRAEAVQAIARYHDPNPDPNAGEHAAARAEMTAAERAAQAGQASHEATLRAMRPGESKRVGNAHVLKLAGNQFDVRPIRGGEVDNAPRGIVDLARAAVVASLTM
jgi:hypothetical protein